MPSKLEILSQVLLSLKSEQNNAMNNINALLNSIDTKEGLIDALKEEISCLSHIHMCMQEAQSFIVQLQNKTLEEEKERKK